MVLPIEESKRGGIRDRQLLPRQHHCPELNPFFGSGKKLPRTGVKAAGKGAVARYHRGDLRR